MYICNAKHELNFGLKNIKIFPVSTIPQFGCFASSLLGAAGIFIMKSSDINVREYVLKANMTFGFNDAISFDNDREAKKFFSKVKYEIKRLNKLLSL